MCEKFHVNETIFFIHVILNHAVLCNVLNSIYNKGSVFTVNII